MQRTHDRNGRASLAPAIGLALALVAGLAWIVGRGGGPSEPAAVDPTGAQASGAAALEAEPSALDAAGRTATPVDDDWRGTSVAASPHVRLAGDGRLAGVVRDRASGAGVANVRVDLLAVTPAASDLLGSMLRLARLPAAMCERARPVAVARSGAGGSFAFEGVRAGTYFLDARGDYHVPDELARARVAPSGDGGPVDVWVRGGGRVVGQVLRPDGRPAAGARVSLYPGPGTFLAAFRSGDLRRLDATTDRDGRFAIAGVTPGSGYDAHALARGFAPSYASVDEVRAGADTSVVVRGRRGGTIAGVVYSAAPDADEDERRPLAGARVAVSPLALRAMQLAEEVLALTAAVTDAEGRYVLRDVPLGDVEVLAGATGHVASRSPVLRVDEGERIEAPPAILRTGPLARGRVVDSAGAPLAGVHVRWFLGRLGQPEQLEIGVAPLLHQAVGDFAYPLTDAEGRFVAGPFADEPPHELYFMKDGYGFERATWDPASAAELVVTLVAGGTVEGVVRDATSGAPVASFVVTSADRIDARSDEPSSFNPFSGGLLVEDPEGRFRVQGVRAGRAELVFEAAGYHRETVRVRVAEGASETEVVVELHAGGTVRGHVVDSAGEPVTGAQVAALGGGGWSVARTFAKFRGHMGAGEFDDSWEEQFTNRAVTLATRMGFLSPDAVSTGPDGAFELTSLEPGEHALVARHRDYALGEGDPFQLAAGETKEDMRVRLDAGATLFGRVSDRFGRPLPGALVIAVSPAEYSGDTSAEAALYADQADEDGDYAIEHMAGGGYFLTLARGDEELNPFALIGSMKLDLVQVPAGRRTRRDLVDASAAACRVFGTVTSGGEPMTDGVVVALSTESAGVLGVDLKMAKVRPDATYEFPGLAPGAYRFAYQAPGNDLRVDVRVPDAQEQRVDLALPLGGVRGRVVDAPSGEAVAGARVRIERAGGAADFGLLAPFVAGGGGEVIQESAADGTFELFGLAAGAYVLRASPPRRSDAPLGPADATPVTLGEDEVVRDVELALVPGLSISGRVLGPDGAPVARASVTAHDRGGRLVWPVSTRADRDGRYALDGLAAGTWDVVASATGFADGWLRGLELAHDALAGVDVSLSLGVPLAVRVRDAKGAPVAGALARLLFPDGREAAGIDAATTLLGWFDGDSATGADGRLDLGAHAPGTYTIEVRRDDAVARREGVVLSQGAPLEVEVELP